MSELEKVSTTIDNHFSNVQEVQAQLIALERKLADQMVVDVFRDNRKHTKKLADNLAIVRKLSAIVSDLSAAYESLIQRISNVRDYDELPALIRPVLVRFKVARQGLASLMEVEGTEPMIGFMKVMEASMYAAEELVEVHIAPEVRLRPSLH